MTLALAYFALLFASVLFNLVRKGLLFSARPSARRPPCRPGRYDRVTPAAAPAPDHRPRQDFSAAWRIPAAEGWTWGSAARQPAYGPSLLTMGFVLVDLSRLAVEPDWAANLQPALPEPFSAAAHAELLPPWPATSPSESLVWAAEPFALEPPPALAWMETFQPEVPASGADLGWFV